MRRREFITLLGGTAATQPLPSSCTLLAGATGVRPVWQARTRTSNPRSGQRSDDVSKFFGQSRIALVIGVWLATSPVLAQSWPTRPVTMVIPFAAGGGTDATGRILAPRLSELLGQQVIVENVGGAGGMTGSNRVAKAAPDGYQFLFANTGTAAFDQSLYKKPAYDTLKDFTPVSLVTEGGYLLLARKDAPP